MREMREMNTTNVFRRLPFFIFLLTGLFCVIGALALAVSTWTLDWRLSSVTSQAHTMICSLVFSYPNAGYVAGLCCIGAVSLTSATVSRKHHSQAS